MTVLNLAERDITLTCRQYLEVRGWRAVRINAGPFGKSGMPDFLFLNYKTSDHLWIEFKAPNGRIGPKQREWIDDEVRRGAKVLIVSDIDWFINWYETAYGIQGQMRLGAQA